MIAAMAMHARAVQRMLRRAELDGDCLERTAPDVRHLDRIPHRMATDGALRIRYWFALSRHAEPGSRGSRMAQRPDGEPGSRGSRMAQRPDGEPGSRGSRMAQRPDGE